MVDDTPSYGSNVKHLNSVRTEMRNKAYSVIELTTPKRETTGGTVESSY